MTGESKFLIGIAVLTIIGVIGGVLLFGSDKSSTQTSSTDLFANISHTKGNPNAPVKIVEFADFQCPACATAQPIIIRVMEEASTSAYFAFRHYPLPTHGNANIAAKAAEASAKQGKFWEM